MPDSVGEHFGDDVVDGDLDRCGGPLDDLDIDVDGDRRPRASVLSDGPRPTRASDAGVEPTGELPYLLEDQLEIPLDLGRWLNACLPGPLAIVARARWRSRPNARSRCWVPSWRSRPIRRRGVVPGGDDAGARCDEVGARGCVRHRRGDQVGELAQPDLRSLRDRLLSRSRWR